MALDRLQRLLPALWLGWLLCVALLATPAPFATLLPSDAGRVVARMLAQEAGTALLLGAMLLLLERRQVRQGGGPQFTLATGLVLGAVFCTVAGYYALQPLMAAARAGQGALSFGQLHAVSAGFYVLKTVLVAVLAWRSLPGLSRTASS